MHPFAAKVREMRLKHKWTLRELSEKVNKTPGYLSRIEMGEEIPSPEFSCYLARALRIKPEALLVLAKRVLLQRAEAIIDQRQEEGLRRYKQANKQSKK
jgi:transcriptional regulator with XRE-family HTH domain